MIVKRVGWDTSVNIFVNLESMAKDAGITATVLLILFNAMLEWVTVYVVLDGPEHFVRNLVLKELTEKDVILNVNVRT